MNSREFENFVALLNGFLRLSRRESRAIVDELRDHLESRVADLLEQGYEQNEAKQLALEEFGDAVAMANQFRWVSFRNQKRWIMKLSTGLVVVAFLGAWSGWTFFGEPGRVPRQETAAAQEFSQEQDAEAEDPFGGRVQNVPGARSASIQTERGLSDRSVRLKETLTLLKETRFSAQFVEQPFGEVLAELGESLPSIRFHLDKSCADDSAFSNDTLFSFQFGIEAVYDELQLALKEYDATFVVDGSVVKIISSSAAMDFGNLRREMIDCRGLLQLIAKHDRRILERHIQANYMHQLLNLGIAGPGVLGTGMMGGMFQTYQGTASAPANANTASKEEPDLASVARLKAIFDEETLRASVLYTPEQILVSVIRESVNPDEWEFHESTASVVGGVLILVASEATIDSTRDFLQDLEARLSSQN
ncbi:MAG TPA: permease prefix domain 1-containing protein [Pirellulaceae bacterium]|nr:permease prefix domain 1-containing protein [Pirellulaceae bacterium]